MQREGGCHKDKSEGEGMSTLNTVTLPLLIAGADKALMHLTMDPQGLMELLMRLIEKQMVARVELVELPVSHVSFIPDGE